MISGDLPVRFITVVEVPVIMQDCLRSKATEVACAMCKCHTRSFILAKLGAVYEKGKSHVTHMSRLLSLWRTSCTCRYTTGDCYPETFFDKSVKEDTACMNFLQYAYSEWSSTAAIAVEKPFRGGRDKKGRRSTVASSTVASSL